ncbi:MAG: hypothetical protein ABIK12_10045 [Pseudomonadota bacterium]
MATSKTFKNRLSLKGLVELFGFPTMPQLIIDGINIDETLYRKLIVRFAQLYLDTVHLRLSLAGEDELLVEPFAGSDWQDVAYWLGNLINQEAGSVKITAPSDFLRPKAKGAPPYESLAEAVLDNLHSLKNAPEVYGMGTPGDALRKAAENALEVKKVRELVRQDGVG